ncbi:MAG: hypothetical protein ACN6NX_11605, partial [Acinetobacter sp.]
SSINVNPLSLRILPPQNRLFLFKIISTILTKQTQLEIKGIKKQIIAKKQLSVKFLKISEC